MTQQPPPDLRSVSSSSLDFDSNGFAEQKRRSNFYVNDHKLVLAPDALFIFTEANPIRQAAVWLMTWKWFDRIILLVIAFNSITLAMTDYSLDAIDLATMEPDPSKSWRNLIPASTEALFTAIFTLELIIKVIGMGAFVDEGSYLRSGWNWLDFIVVLSGLLTNLPGMPNVSAIRAIRVLRPLRTLSILPGMRMLLSALLASIPSLVNVIALLVFIFFVFGILAIQMWVGALHGRCRMTPLPIAMSEQEVVDTFLPSWTSYFGDNSSLAAVHYVQQVVQNRTAYPWCTAALTAPPNIAWLPETSPWYTPRDCVWPIFEQDTRLCSLDGSGKHTCDAPLVCGSNYDEFGNARFTSTLFMDRELEIPELDFGIPNVDWIGGFFVAIFQTITLEGWSDIMYQLQDATNAWLPAIVFIALVFSGSFFLVNLTLAVIWDTFTLQQAVADAEEHQAAMQTRFQDSMSSIPGTRDGLASLSIRGNQQDAGTNSDTDDDGIGPMPMIPVSPVPVEVLAPLPPRALPTLPPASPTNSEDSKSNAEVEPDFTLAHAPYSSPTSSPSSARRRDSPPLSPTRQPLSSPPIVAIADGMPNPDVATAGGRPLHLPLLRISSRRGRLPPLPGRLSPTMEVASDQSPDSPGPRSRTTSSIHSAMSMPSAVHAPAAPTSPPRASVTRVPVPLLRIRHAALQVLHHSAFEPVISAVILANTVVLSLDHYPMDVAFSYGLETANFVLSMVFVLEMAIKLVALGPKAYLRDKQNAFDCIIVVTSIVELATDPPGFIDSTVSNGGVSGVFRALRLLRIIKFARRLQSVREVVAAILRSTKVVGNFILLLAIFIYIFALVGMALFANKFRFHPVTGLPLTVDDPLFFDTLPSRVNFDSLPWALLAVFQTLTTENWNQILYDGWRSTGVPAMVYFVLLIVVGVFIVLNLFLAILLGNFSVSASPDDQIAAASGSVLWQRLMTPFARISNMLERMYADDADDDHALPRHGLNQIVPAPPDTDAEIRDELAIPVPPHAGAPRVVSVQSVATPLTSDSPGSPTTTPSIGASARFRQHQLHGNALCCLSRRNRFRQALARVVLHPAFDNCVLALVVLNSIMLAIDTPLLDPDSTLGQVLAAGDIVVTILFTLECILKIAVFGFAFHKDAYLTSPWNWLDFIIVLTSFLSSLQSSSSELRSLRSMRTLRALRPLRVISRYPSLQLVVRALFRAIPAILNVLVLACLFFFLCGVVGVSFLKGGLSQCGGPVYASLSAAQQALIFDPEPFYNLAPVQQAWGNGSYVDVTSKAICLWMGAEWTPVVDQTFDNIISALGTLFQLSTTEGWMDMTIAAIDSRGIDMQPERDNNMFWSIYFVLFIVLGSFFLINLFIGVIIDNFTKMKEELGNEAFLTPSQRIWVKTQEVLYALKPRKKVMPPRQPWRLMVFRLINSVMFEKAIILAILGNTVTLAAVHFGQSTSFSNFQDMINIFFANVFTLEFILKYTALGNQYFRESWNRFDFSIVVLTNIAMILPLMIDIRVGIAVTLVRVVRVGRVVRLVQGTHNLRKLLNTLWVTLPSLANIGSLMFLLFFIYAVMGIQLFAEVKDGSELGDHANFRDFGTALITLVRCATGESWDYLMYDLSISSDCDPNPAWDTYPMTGCGSWIAFPFMYSFTMILSFVIIQVFIAVILEGFGNLADEENMKLSRPLLEAFTERWMHLDPEATMMIKSSKLPALFRMLPTPLGFHGGRTMTDEQLWSEIKVLLIPTLPGGLVHFHDVVLSVARHVIKVSLAEHGLEFEEDNRLDTFSNRRLLANLRRPQAQFTVSHIYAAQTIADTFRTFKMRQNVANLKDGYAPPPFQHTLSCKVKNRHIQRHTRELRFGKAVMRAQVSGASFAQDKNSQAMHELWETSRPQMLQAEASLRHLSQKSDGTGTSSGGNSPTSRSPSGSWRERSD